MSAPGRSQALVPQPFKGEGTPASAPAPDSAPPLSAAERQRALDALFDDVAAEPWAHDFRALLRRVEALCPQWPRMGSAPRPQMEALRLGQEPELDFAPAALAGLRRSASGPPRLGVRFFGLFGPQGPMPLHFTEHVRERVRNHGDPATLRFLDLFHHRLLALHYRAWAQAQPVVQHDRPADDRFAVWLGACAGIGRAVADDPWQRAELHLAGVLAQRTRSAEGLAQLLSQQLGDRVRVQTHVGQWLAIEPDDQSTLGFAANRPERLRRAPARLGHSATLGHKVWDRQYRFRLVIGPLRAQRYRELLPGGPAHPACQRLVRRHVGHDLRWDLQLCLDRRDLQPLRLGRQDQPLGLMSWLAGRRAVPPDPVPATDKPPAPADVAAALEAAGHRVDLRLVAGEDDRGMLRQPVAGVTHGVPVA
jgi:type VI secretion system protein ImpH